MSRFTGNYDLYDEIKSLGGGNMQIGFNRFNGTKLYIQTEEKFQNSSLTWKQALAKSRKPIKYESLLDLAPYFTHLIQSQTIGKLDEPVNNTVLITRKSAYEIYEENNPMFNSKTYQSMFNNQLWRWRCGEKIQ